MPANLLETVAGTVSLLAQAATPGNEGTGPSPSFQWGIVLFMAILGMLVTLTPTKRVTEIKKVKDE